MKKEEKVIEKNINGGYNLKNAQLAVVIGITIFAIVISCLRLVRLGSEGILVSVVFGGGVILLAWLLYFLKINDVIKNIIYSLIPIISIFLLFIIYGTSIQYHYLLMISAIFSVMFFDKRVLLTYIFIITIGILGIYLYNPSRLLGVESKPVYFIVILIGIEGSCILLYLLVTWVSNIISNSIAKEEEAKKLVDQLTNILAKIEEKTICIDNEIGDCSRNADTLKNSSRSIVEAVGQINNITQEQAENVANINVSMIESLNNINNTKNSAINVQNSSTEVQQQIDEGMNRINEVKNTMDNIGIHVGGSFKAIEELYEQINDVNSLLSIISQIAEQTKLLALNANIEAARAGEMGKGFAVVAHEVGVLADKSDEIVKKINETNILMQEKAKNVHSNFIEEKNIVLKGEEIVEEVQKYFREMKTCIDETNLQVKSQTNEVEEITKYYTSMQSSVESIGAISQENAASIEEITETIKNQYNQIEAIAENLNIIHKYSKELQDLK